MGGAAPPRGSPPRGYTASEDCTQACPPWTGCEPGGREGGAARWGGCLRELGPSLRSQSALTWRTTPITGRFRVCPGTGAGHSSISLHTVDTGGRVRSLGATAGTESTPAAADSHSPASRQGAGLLKYSGAIRLRSAWNSRTKGRRDTSTRDCRVHRAGEMQSQPRRS